MNRWFKISLCGAFVAFLLSVRGAVVTAWNWGTVQGCTPNAGIGTEAEIPASTVGYYYAKSSSGINSSSTIDAWGLSLGAGEKVKVELSVADKHGSEIRTGWVAKTDSFSIPDGLSPGDVTLTKLKAYSAGDQSATTEFLVECTGSSGSSRTYEVRRASDKYLLCTLKAQQGLIWLYVASTQGATGSSVHTYVAYSGRVRRVAKPEGAVENFNVEYDSVGNKAALSWAPHANATHYKLKYRRNGGAWTALDDNCSGTGRVHADLETGSSYCYEILPCNEEGDGAVWAFSETITASSKSAYTISYLDCGTPGPSHPQAADVGTTFAVSAPTKKGHAFLGWKVTSGLNAGTAKWGTSRSELSAVGGSGTLCTAGEAPVYFKDLAGISGSVQLTAIWEKVNSYTVAYELAGGTAGQAAPTECAFGRGYAFPSPTKTGHVFDGWSFDRSSLPDEALCGDVNPPGADLNVVLFFNPHTAGAGYDTYYFMNLCGTDGGTVTMTANWKPVTYSVSYTGLSSVQKDSVFLLGSAAFGETLFVPALSQYGWTFAGWKVSSGLDANTAKWSSTGETYARLWSDSAVVPPGSDGYSYFKNLSSADGAKVTLEAVWTKDENTPSYAIKYDLNGGTESLPCPDGAEYGASVKVGNPTKTGYAFTGWTVKSGLNAATAKWGYTSTPDKSISSSSTVCGGEGGYVYFVDLKAKGGGSVTLSANWKERADFSYENVFGTIILTGYAGDGGDVVIPATFGGKSLKEIGDNAFDGCDAVTSVTIPSGVTHIGEVAFGSCSNMTSVSIPSSVTHLGYAAFYECSGLKSVTVPAAVTYIGEAVFCRCSGLVSVKFEQGVKEVGAYMFSLCSGLETVSFPSSVTNIGPYAFNGSGLSSVTITPQIANVCRTAFDSCENLTAIDVSADNARYESRCGMLCTKEPSSVVTCPKGRSGSVEIPSGVTAVGEYAFERCYGLKEVTLPQTVTEIGRDAFYYCTWLTTVTVPSGVAKIGKGAFTGCSRLKTVYVDVGDEERVAALLSAAGADLSKLTVLARARVCRISFDAGIGSGGTDSTNAIFGAALPQIEVPRLDGYTFGGYYADEACAGKRYYDESGAGVCDWDIDADVTLHAKWTKNPEETADLQMYALSGWRHPAFVAAGGRYASEHAFPSNGNLAVSFAVVNRGALPVTTITVRVSVSAETVSWRTDRRYSFSGTGLGRDRYFSQNLSWEMLGQLPCGNYCLTVTADPGQLLNDSDRSNNSYSFYFSIVDADRSVRDEPGVRDPSTTGAVFVQTNCVCDGRTALQFGPCDAGVTNELRMTLMGPGKLSFRWTGNAQTSMRMSFSVDGEVRSAAIGAVSSWMLSSDCAIDAGSHVVSWRYGGFEPAKYGCLVGFLDDIVWTPSEIVVPPEVTGGRELGVTSDWVSQDLERRFGAGKARSFVAKFGADLSRAMSCRTGKRDAQGNAMSVWHDFVAGTDPTDESSRFTTRVEMRGGVPVITWDPALNGEGVKSGVRTYTTYGSSDLKKWEVVPNGRDAEYRFFKVSVDMP